PSGVFQTRPSGDLPFRSFVASVRQSSSVRFGNSVMVCSPASSRAVYSDSPAAASIRRPACSSVPHSRPASTGNPMNQTSSSHLGPLHLGARSALVQFGAVVAGILLLTVASWIEVPMVPVPMTMQTFAVLLVGALYGWRLGALTVAAWLAGA